MANSPKVTENHGGLPEVLLVLGIVKHVGESGHGDVEWKSGNDVKKKPSSQILSPDFSIVGIVSAIKTGNDTKIVRCF